MNISILFAIASRDAKAKALATKVEDAAEVTCPDRDQCDTTEEADETASNALDNLLPDDRSRESEK